MSKVDVLIEVQQHLGAAFGLHRATVESESESLYQAEALISDLAGYGLSLVEGFAPVPLFSQETVYDEATGFATFASPDENPDVFSESVVVAAQVDKSKLEKLKSRTDVKVWLNSELSWYDSAVDEEETHPFDLARSGGGVDCPPYRPAVTLHIIRQLLGVEAIWRDGFRGQNIVVGIIDQGVDGQAYPVVGGYVNPNTPPPGSAAISSHGSMCAADILVAAPAAKLYDYPFIGVPRSGGALQMFQEVLNQRRLDGTPHLTNNSYGFYGRPSQQLAPNHEAWDHNHPLHRKIREVVASGAPAFFAVGNCGAPCPDRRCHSSVIGSGNSIFASNSLAEVITVAAVNSRHERIGYSSQGPGCFEPKKPDVAAYSHFFGNLGPGRPAGGGPDTFDQGTSAASPLAAGVGALLMSAIPGLTPDRLKEALIASAINIGKPGWDEETGHGVIHAAASYAFLKRRQNCGS